jgi:hypothetical protein
MRDFWLRVAYVVMTMGLTIGSLWWYLPPWLYSPVCILVLLWTVREIAPRGPAPLASHPAIADFTAGERPYHRRAQLAAYYAGLDPRVAAGLQQIRCAELAHEVERECLRSTRWSDERVISLEQAVGVAVRDYVELRRRATDYEMELAE